MAILSGKVALVTGATRGIGRAVALKFASEGADVAFTYLSSAQKAVEVKEEIESLGVKALAIASDAASFEAAHNVVNQVIEEFGRIDILVNNAGITKDTFLLRMSEEQWDSVIDSNLKSAYNYTHAVAPLMARSRKGVIIYMSSIVGLHGNACQVNYSASKAGIIGMAKSVAKELGGRGVRSNVIAPGFIQTDMTNELPEEVLKQWQTQIPLKRCGSVDDVANCALFLASDLSSYITGQTILVDGGMGM